jgi:TolB-like protein/Flp pilus assembly protein TadD
LKPTNFFAELKRRKVYRVAIAYAVASWLLIQIATQTFPFFDIPNWAVRLEIGLLALGFPIALILAWAYDLTPGGIVRTDDIEPAKAAVPVAKPPPPEKSIAVLPFENLSDDQQNTYFADGIQDDILSNLAKVADLKVISRTSVRQYRTGTRNIREIGEALGVAYILEGTVRRDANRVRINAQFIDARTDLHVWNDTFDREITDLFALQTELARRIAFALRANLSPREKASMQVHPTTDLDAYDAYLRARALFRWSGVGDAQENGEQALPLLDQAIKRDPEFALAYALASRVHAELYWFGYDKRPERLALAKTTAETALRLRPDLGDAHIALAFYYYYAFREYELARNELTIALRAIPNEPDVPSAFGVLDRRQGRWEDSIANLNRARQLDPRNSAAIWNLLETHTYLHHYREAERAIDEGLAMFSDAHFFSIARAALPLREKGETAPLRAAVCQIPKDFNPGGAVTTIAVRVSLMERDYAEASRLLASSTRERFNDNGLSGMAGALDGYIVPRVWYEGLIARGQGDAGKARQAFEAARREVENDRAQWPDEAKTVAMLGLVNAALGRKKEAIREGRRAVELLPIAKDAVDGPLLATNLAVIYGQVGELDLAFAELERLLALPAGPTAGMLRAEPEWDSLRGDPRFERLVNG